MSGCVRCPVVRLETHHERQENMHTPNPGIMWYYLQKRGAVPGSSSSFAVCEFCFGIVFLSLIVGGLVEWFMNRPKATEPTLDDKRTEVASAPLPQPRPPDVAEAKHDVAPSPRAWMFSPPATGYTSGWKKIGVVEARIAGVAVMRVPLVDKASRTFDSPKPVLTVWIEVRTEAITRKVELRHWQTFGEDCRLIDANEVTFDWARFGMGIGPQTGLPHLQVVQATGKSCFDVMVFAVPGRESGDLRLLLNAERVGEIGTFVFLLPATAIKP